MMDIFGLSCVKSVSEMYEVLNIIPDSFSSVEATISFDVNDRSEVVLPAALTYKSFTIDHFEDDRILSIKLCMGDGTSIEHKRVRGGDSLYSFWFDELVQVAGSKDQMVLKIDFVTESGISFRRIHARAMLFKPKYHYKVKCNTCMNTFAEVGIQL